MNDSGFGQADQLARLLDQLRTAGPEVGRQLEGHHLKLRLQNFGGSCIGLRIPLKTRPKVNAAVELVECKVRRLRGKWVLDVVERSPGSPEQSAALFSDIAARLRDVPEDAVPVHVESVLRAWRTAFSGRRDLLPDNEIIGLLGELKVIQDMMSSGIASHAAVVSWTGPEGDDHDFTLAGSFQVEVKATSPHSERLQISNEHQLEAKDIPLYLACVRAAIVPESPTTTTLPRLAEALSDQMDIDGTKSLFGQKLESAGLDRFDERYEDIHLECTSISLYRVEEGMPRVTPAHLTAGVSQVSYQLVTSDLHSYQVDRRPWSTAERSRG